MTQDAQGAFLYFIFFIIFASSSFSLHNRAFCQMEAATITLSEEWDQRGPGTRQQLQDRVQEVRFCPPPSFILFIYFWLHWVFVAACRLSLVADSGGYSSLWCMCFSLQWLLLLWSTGCRHAGFSSCGMQAQ